MTMIEEVTDDKIEVIQIGNEFLETFKFHIGKLIYELEDSIIDRSEELGVCPFCQSNITYDTYKEQSEYFGQPVHEYITVGKCENCGYTSNN